jgi:hypothetical protein
MRQDGHEGCDRADRQPAEQQYQVLREYEPCESTSPEAEGPHQRQLTTPLEDISQLNRRQTERTQ